MTSSGRGTLRGIANLGEIVGTGIFIESGIIKIDLGRAKSGEPLRMETGHRRNPAMCEWPIRYAVILGASRDQMMGRHKANDIPVAYVSWI
jgi:hypothetical protein